MSKLQELIRELCPDGVEYKMLGDFCEKVSSYQWIGTEERYYIDLSSVDVDRHNIVNATLINRGNAPSRAKQHIKAGDVLFATTRPTQLRSCIIPEEYNDHICSTGYCVLRVSDTTLLLQSWLYYNINTSAFLKFVEKNETKGGSYPAISDATVKKFIIPLPPLPVQEEIVRILDHFTNLAAELQAELQARKEQYEYYRNKLLMFDKIGGVRKA